MAYTPAIFFIASLLRLRFLLLGKEGTRFQQEAPAQASSVSASQRSTVSAYLSVGNSAQRVARDVWTESFLPKIPIWDIMPKKALWE